MRLIYDNILYRMLLISYLQGMMGTVRHEPGKGFILDGYPAGSTVHGLALSEGQDLCRLMIFEGDLHSVNDWLAVALDPSVPDRVREGLAIAAWIKFCGCFEGTSGLRQRPLKQKELFTFQDRRLVEQLRQIRNKIVAHDEQVFPAHSPFVVMDEDAKAIEAGAIGLQYPVYGFEQLPEIKRLARRAIEWVTAEVERLSAIIIETINNMPTHLRKAQRDDAGLTISFIEKSFP